MFLSPFGNMGLICPVGAIRAEAEVAERAMVEEEGTVIEVIVAITLS